ncbi:E3 ubiquitin-protein ligase ATL31-like [Typha angustifolia]|uniref:E3 ubiquitin-protein ligase ATL31-like n=1 Tax=Typha angustifolia TaxID=59011 RepID=UPI003C2D5BBA
MAPLQLLLVLLLVTARFTKASASRPIVPTTTYDDNSSESLSVLLYLSIVLAVLLVLSVALYLLRCRGDRTPAVTATPPCPSLVVGLDPAVVDSFPAVAYAAVKGLKGQLECAVCLSEFSDEEKLRLLPRCCHVFHPACIGAWLASHVTCPVCRANLADLVV